MTLIYQQVDSRRYKSSVVYSFTCSISGNQIMEGDEPRVFSIQIEDSYQDKAEALQKFLDDIEQEQTQQNEPIPSMSDLLGD